MNCFYRLNESRSFIVTVCMTSLIDVKCDTVDIAVETSVEITSVDDKMTESASYV